MTTSRIASTRAPHDARLDPTPARASIAANPLLGAWTGPFGLAPFGAVRPEHYVPAFEEGMRQQIAEVDAIAAQTEPPSFANTVAAFDRSGRLLDRVAGLFWNLTASETSPELQAVQRELAPKSAAHGNALYMHQGLFARIDALYRQRESLVLTPEDRRVLERFHMDFVRAGARLEPVAQKRYGEVMEKLAELTTRFSQNVLADETAYRLVLRTEGELAGLPDFVRAAARQAAVERGLGDTAEGELPAHVITLSRSLIVPFLTFSTRRDLREQAWQAWTSRGEHAGEHDNRGVAAEILQLRLEQARLHGYASNADYALADTMAGTQAAVTDLLMQVWNPAKARAVAERADLLEVARAEDGLAAIEPWDWRYYAEKVRQRRYDLDEAETKPYLELGRVTAAAFDVANRLFGIRFLPRADVHVYHPDVRAYEVKDAADRTIGLFLHDNYARPTKKSGAWMSVYRSQSRQSGEAVLPIVVNNNNFAKGADGEPTLLSFDDARTLFHEFGHGLHGLLSNVTWERVSGTSVLRDFVELPSQLFEHWFEEREVLKQHARHYRTGEPMPDALIDKIERARHFNQGYESVRYTASALVDMAAHAYTGDQPLDVVAFEQAELERLGLPHGVGLNHRLTHFQHLFSGSGYAAGYYVYMWAEVLDADGYDAFLEAGSPFDRATAERLLQYIYSSGDSMEPGTAYRAFRGRAPTVEPMLRGRGLLA